MSCAASELAAVEEAFRVDVIIILRLLGVRLKVKAPVSRLINGQSDLRKPWVGCRADAAENLCTPFCRTPEAASLQDDDGPS
jgi:hypothetical protein